MIHHSKLPKYSLTVCGQTFEGLTKKDAIFKVVQLLCASGMHPDNFPKFPHRSREQTWLYVDGRLNSAEFRRLAIEKLVAQKKPTDNNRWFWEDTELIYAGDRTYALQAKWGDSTEETLSLLQQTFPQAGIAFRTVAPGDAVIKG